MAEQWIMEASHEWLTVAENVPEVQIAAGQNINSGHFDVSGWRTIFGIARLTQDGSLTIEQGTVRLAGGPPDFPIYSLVETVFLLANTPFPFYVRVYGTHARVTLTNTSLGPATPQFGVYVRGRS